MTIGRQRTLATWQAAKLSSLLVLTRRIFLGQLELTRSEGETNSGMVGHG